MGILSSTAGVAVRETLSVTGARRVLAEHMVRCHTVVPAVTILEEWSVDPLVRFRAKYNEAQSATGGERVSYTHLLIKAIAIALKEHPLLNSTITDTEIQLLEGINIGVATALEDGALIVPVLQNANQKDLSSIATQMRDLTTRAARGALRPADVRGGTFTLTNIGGASDARWQTPLVNAPQCAIMAVGTVRQAPVVCDGALAIGWLMCVSLSFDHRIVSGKPAAGFLRTVAEICGNPEILEPGSRGIK
jgi:pyruvate dehydrogenase E2 component (dihydrolipoamide acetyltransferase)